MTVYHDDDEAADIWHRDVGLPAGTHPASWHGRQLLVMGVPGPVRPVLGDLLRPRARVRPDGGPSSTRTGSSKCGTWCSCSSSAVQVRPRRTSTSWANCRRKNIDTGMGLERMAALLQGVDNIYEIDTTRAILDRASDLTGRRYGADERSTMCGCGWSPTTPAPARSSSATAWCPAMRDAGMCCAGSCGGSSGPCGCSGATSRRWRELDARHDRGDGPAVPRARATTRAASNRSLRPRRRRSCRRCGPGTQIFDVAVPEVRGAGGQQRRRRQGLHAARHLRLPHRSDARDGRRAGPRGRRGRVSGGS